jgi:hypothetical protein
MNSVQALVLRAQRDVALIDAVKRARTAMKLIHFGEIYVGDYLIDLTDDIQRLTAALMLLGYVEKE